MKLRDLVRRDKKAIKDELKNKKRKNRPVPDEYSNIIGGGPTTHMDDGIDYHPGPV